ncbi:hypothetical protein ACU686_44160 [Yinghuangia aomiensis]
MTVPPVLRLVDGSGIADLAGYLVRLLRYDRAAAIHLRAAGDVLATFGRVPFGTGTAGRPGTAHQRTRGTRAGRRDGVGRATARRAREGGRRGDGTAGGDPAGRRRRKSPSPTRSPAPRGPASSRPAPAGRARPPSPIPVLVHEVAEAVGRFRARTEALPAPDRTRAALDRIAEDVWSKTLPGAPGTGLPSAPRRAAASLGFLGSVDAGADASVTPSAAGSASTAPSARSSSAARAVELVHTPAPDAGVVMPRSAAGSTSPIFGRNPYRPRYRSPAHRGEPRR